MGYRLPTNTSWVTCSWQCHRDRPTPSSEPGTDYGCGTGSQLYAPGTGKVVDVRTSNSGASGRFITMDLDDGRRTRSLHLSTTGSVKVGQRYAKGAALPGAKSGGSGFGSNTGYGPHVHQTLWTKHAYNFCSSCTIDFAKYVDGKTTEPNQRIAGPEGVNGRDNPNTSKPPTQFLEPGTVGDFDGWINGESVSGNKVWFRGEHSKDFFWSGGFTSKSIAGLANLNPVAVGTRTVLATAVANRRNDPSTQNPPTGELAAGASSVMDGWITGETVSGNSVWYREKSSQDYYWSGGFTSQSKTGLKDLNTPAPPGTSRTVLSTADANVRDLPYTSSPAVGAEDPGEIIEMSGWTNGEQVNDNDVWFRRKIDSDWMWSGGFTDKTTTGLTKVPAPAPPLPPDTDNPRGLRTYPPVYDGAFQGLDAPLGHTDCKAPTLSNYTPRNKAGADQHPVTPIIDTYIIHHTGTTADQMDYFSYCNTRTSAPTWYMRTNGSVSEMIRPKAKPAATGPEWNWRSVATETQNQAGAPTWAVTVAQKESHARIIAWLAEFDGLELDGIPVSFKIDREHVKTHQECLPGTECPGPDLQGSMDAIIARAKEIYAANNPVDPDCPECPECPDPTDPFVDYDRIAQEVNDEAARRREGWT